MNLEKKTEEVKNGENDIRTVVKESFKNGLSEENGKILKIEFGNRLRGLLEEKGIKQTTLAKDINVSDKAVSKWINGETYPNTDKLSILSIYLDVSINYLLCVDKMDENHLVLLFKEMGKNKIFRRSFSIVGLFIFALGMLYGVLLVLILKIIIKYI